MFTDVARARRIERAEAQFTADIAGSIARRRPTVDVLAREIAGGVAVWAGPTSPMNKLIGVGFDGPLDEGVLADIEREFGRRGEPLRAEVATLADASVCGQLTRRGYVLAGFENVLGRSLDLTVLPKPAANVAVTETGAADREWLDTVVTGFMQPDPVSPGAAPEEYPRDVLETAMADMAETAGFHRYLGYLDGQVAGGASMRVFEGVAQLCGASTLRQHRRRGLQSAMLQARLGFAARYGCDIAVVTTQPGSKSQQNVQRQGFALLYARAVLVKSFDPNLVGSRLNTTRPAGRSS